VPPIHDLALIGGRWSLPILVALLDGPMRFSDLRRKLDGISAKQLTIRLGDLQSAGLLQRTALVPSAAASAYMLSPHVGSLRPALKLLRAWQAEQRECRGAESGLDAYPS